MQKIESAGVEQFVDHASVIDRINQSERQGKWLPWAAWILAFVLLLAGGITGLLFGGITVALAYGARNYMRTQSKVLFDYQLDETARGRFDCLGRAVDALAQCRKLWQVGALGITDDWKRHAGARQIIRRSSIQLRRGTPRCFAANVEIAFLKLSRQELYFLPDMIIVRQGGRFGSISYRNLRIGHRLSKFNETDPVPQDATVVGTTWRYVNKNGGPDRRFNNNRQISVVCYGEVELQSDAGLRLAIMTSAASAAETFATGMRIVQN